MFNYKLINKADININEKIIDNILINISKNIKKEQNWTLNIIFMDDDSIKNLNNNYRNIDKTTDVLSFHYYEDFSNLDKEDVSWEIILSESKIKSQAIEYWLWEEKEFYKLLIHSVLHILWYDHEEDEEYLVMQELENKIFKELFEK